MKIAIHTSDLDHTRIDGTRVYMHNVLKRFGSIGYRHEFVLYHSSEYNPALAPMEAENFIQKKLLKMPFWTQTAFSAVLIKDKPDVLWMPMANIPLLRRKNLKTVVTIHDLAFKYFPQHFPPRDLKKLNILAKMAIERSQKIIAVSQSTKDDILKFFPDISENKIKVVYHGFDLQLFQNNDNPELSKEILAKYNLNPKKYLLYVGAIQPRKNLEILIEAFEKIKPEMQELKLVLAGEKAWMWQNVEEKISKSNYKDDIITTGPVKFSELPLLYKNAKVFVFPSLYEGFGIPLLEAFASSVPVVAANNSSLMEIGRGVAEFFETEDSRDLAKVLMDVCPNDLKQKEMIALGLAHVKRFSWDKCAKETLECILK